MGIRKRWINFLYKAATGTKKTRTLLTPNGVMIFGAEPIHGPEAFKAFLSWLFEGLPNATVTVDNMIAEGDKVACRWTMQGTHKGPLFGFAATGRSAQISGFTFYRISDGKVVEEAGTGNTFKLMQQIGAVISPPQT